MKHLAKLFGHLSGAALVTLALSGCGRGEYAMLPKTSPYHETYSAAKTAPAVPAATAATVAPAPAAPAAPAEAPKALATAPLAPATPTAPVAAAPASEAPAAKPTAAQRVLVNKLVRKAHKLASKTQVGQHHNAASEQQANALSRYIKLGLILLIIGVLLSLLGGPLGVLGYILGLVGVVFLLLGVINEL